MVKRVSTEVSHLLKEKDLAGTLLTQLALTLFSGPGRFTHPPIASLRLVDRFEDHSTSFASPLCLSLDLEVPLREEP